jgi:hypothetical protein
LAKFAETVIRFQHWDMDINKPGNEKSPYRRVAVYPRNDVGEEHIYKFDTNENGVLVLEHVKNY